MILGINAGSTSLKYKLFDDKLKTIIGGTVKFEKMIKSVSTYQDKIKIIGHRVVHGGKEFQKPTVITSDVLKRLAKYNHLAPLHNPYNLEAIKLATRYFPKTKNIAVFDTAFFSTLPDKAKIYPIPLKFYKQGVQRFGFHGISHKYVAQEAAKKLHKDLQDLKLITIHLGGGSSITAIKNGKPIDTSMGFTPLEGLMMLTRSGDIDPGIILEKKLTSQILNFESGIKGISVFGDYLSLLKAMRSGNKLATLAFNMFVYRIQKYIGAYYAILNGINALVFTGAIGAGERITRDAITRGLSILKGIPILAIKTDEELAIARVILSEAKDLII